MNAESEIVICLPVCPNTEGRKNTCAGRSIFGGSFMLLSTATPQSLDMGFIQLDRDFRKYEWRMFRYLSRYARSLFDVGY